MARRKSEVGRLTEQDEQDIKTLEGYIDEQLDLEYNPNVGTYVTIDFLKLQAQIEGREVNHRIIRKMEELYKAAEWTVRVETGAREGSFIQFL